MERKSWTFCIFGGDHHTGARITSGENKARDGVELRHDAMCVGDAILIEPRLGLGCELVGILRDYVRRELMGPDSSNLAKPGDEGAAQDARFLLGFEVNVDAITINSPQAKVMDSLYLIRDHVAHPRTRVVTVK